VGEILMQMHRAHREVRMRLGAVPPPVPRFVPPPRRRKPVVREPERVDMRWRGHVLSLPLEPMGPLNVRRVAAEIGRCFGVTPSQMLGPSRSHFIVRPRQYAMYLAKVALKKPLAEIGRKLGGRDHTTVLYAVKGTERRMEDDPLLAAFLNHRAEQYRQQFAEPQS